MYLESFLWLDPNCDIYCGPHLPYMYYDGESFCAHDANEEGKWNYVDFTQGAFVNDPPIRVDCTWCGRFKTKLINVQPKTYTILWYLRSPRVMSLNTYQYWYVLILCFQDIWYVNIFSSNIPNSYLLSCKTI